jgi:hypothetical protein
VVFCDSIHDSGELQLFFALNFEITIFMVSLLNTGFDYIISHLAAIAAKIAVYPKMASPV